MLERIFTKISHGQIENADQQSFLVNLGWSEGIKWKDLLKSKRILLISEAGSGKTYECRSQAQQLWNEGKPAFFIELATLASSNLRDMLDYDEEERLDIWLKSQSDEAIFFLDSYDELELSRKSFEQALKRLKKGISNQLHRVRIVITTRPIPFDEQLVRTILPVPSKPSLESKEDIFAEIAMNGPPERKFRGNNDEIPDWQTVALMPLSDEQISEFAGMEGIDEPEMLLEDLRKRNAQEFARRPQDLIELCADWRVHKRIRKHSDQVRSNLRLKLQARDDRPEPAELSTDKAVDGASRLALAMLVTRQLTIRHSAASDDNDQETALNPSVILSGWQPNELRALLERPLFGFASYGRVRFHHRSVLEFLAAERLRKLFKEKGMPFRALKRLVFAETRGKLIVRPTMRPLAGWLALIDDKIFELLRDNEPAVLFNEGDPAALTHSQRNQVLCAYVEQHGQGGWRGFNVPPYIQIHRFAFPELAGTISQLWQNGIENPETRETFLALIESGRITDCSDIAYEIAIDTNASESERLHSIEALVSLKDIRLTQISTDLSLNRERWPNDIAQRVLTRLFPTNISIEQLCLNLEWLEERSNSVTGMSWQLSQLIAQTVFNQSDLKELRDGLIELVSAGLRWDKEWQPLICDRSHLSVVLAAVCIKGLNLKANNDWLYASVLALRLRAREHGNDDTYNTLRRKLAELDAESNARLFWVDDSLLQSFKVATDPWRRLYRTVDNGVVTLNLDRDLAWIKQILSDSTAHSNDRAVLLEAAIRFSSGHEQWPEIASELKTLVIDQPDFVARVNHWLKPIKPSKWERKQAKQEKQRKRKVAKNKASWIQLRREIIAHPERVFSPERSWNTSWNLWLVMNKQGERTQASGWDRQFIEDQFGVETANRLRSVLMKIWRNETPTLPSERPENERNTILVSWKMGLAAIYAEAEDSNWIDNLSEEEARIAARYAVLERSKLPYWLEELLTVYPNAVDGTLGEELSWELVQYNQQHWHSMLLQEISNASQPVFKLFQPRLLEWLTENENIATDEENFSCKTQRLQQILDALLKHGEQDITVSILSKAQQYLSNDIPHELASVWLPVILRLDPELGVTALEQQISTIEPAVRSQAVIWFVQLFSDRRDSIFHAYPTLTPRVLLRLIRLVYLHVRIEHDIIREGTYTPGVRDDAQHARNNILSALLNLTGEDAWQAKQELSKDPLFTHIKARILALAEESWAQEIDSETLSDQQAIALDRFGETPASTNSAMFAILKDRLSDLDDLLLSDTSPRDAWAGINDEKIMRREIARELKNGAKGLYTVDQEAVTADEKETDIRLRSTVSDHEAIIELKLADGRSARDLRDTIENQLVKKYMAAETSRSGCLLVTIAKERRWEHPDDGQLIELEELQSVLKDEAKRVEETMGSSLALTVHCLDLRPRLPKEK